ncbi:YbaB/EbfC family nucleoid-associated protein [Nocardia sp. NPDC051570]|uniref:YbaB/EbfC family nucleoid-associated protein n=1 Tax=Nocardia sp. NPDC051570 TaxID=3364324 RepID=UPI0037879242
MVEDRARSSARTPEDVEEQQREIAALESRRKLLTATALACDKRIKVTVNADGLLIETKFSADIGDLSYAEVAEALPIAVRAAAREVTRKGRALMWPLLERDTEIPVMAKDVGITGPGASVPLTMMPSDIPASLREPEELQ